MDNIWSPLEVQQRAQQAVAYRDEAVADLYELGKIEAEAKRQLRIGRAQANARMNHAIRHKMEDAPTNAEARKIWVENATVDAEYAADLAGVTYWSQREVIKQHSDVIELCRTLIVSHRESRVDR